MENTTTPSSPQQNIPTRLNNPGDLRDVGQVGATQDSSGFASFQTPQSGYAALLNDVQTKINRSPSSTLADFANTYAPSSDGNNSAQYAANLANKLGVPPNATLSSLQPKIGQFAEAIGGNEGYKNINSTPNPTPAEQEASNPNAPMSTFSKLLLGGLGIAGTVGLGFLTGGAADAALPEEIAAEGATAAGTTTEAPGILSKIGNAAKGIIKSKVTGLATGVGLGDVAGELLGNKGATATQNAGDEQASATTQAGTAEANATQQAEQENIEEQESLADEARTQQQVKDAESAAAALNQSLNSTPTGRVLAQDPKTQATLLHMAQNGYLPDTSSGYNDYAESTKKANDSIGEMSEGIQKVLKEEGGSAHLHEAVQAAYDNIDQYVPVPDRQAAKAHVDELAQAYNEAYGGGNGTVGLDRMEQGKREQYGAIAKWDATRTSAKTAAHRSFAKGLRSTIEKNTKHKDLYNRVMKEEQKIFDAKKIMKKMNGKKALEHKGLFRNLIKNYGEYVGTYIGDRLGGPLGAVIGTMVGDHLKNAVDKRFGKTYFESKDGKKLLDLTSKLSPSVQKTLKKELHKYGVEAEKEEQKLEHAETMDKKRQEYKGKKKITKEKTDYEPYTEPGVIDFGKPGISKKKKSEKGLLTIR